VLLLETKRSPQDIAGARNSRFFSRGHTGAITRIGDPVDFRQEVRTMQPDHAMPFPTDNRLRDDIGLPPLAALRPPLMLIPRTPAYFPTDDRLRDDIGLPPLGDGGDVEGATLSCVAFLGAVDISGFLGRCRTVAASILTPRRAARVVQHSPLRHI
jgi:hypothetical protein